MVQYLPTVPTYEMFSLLYFISVLVLVLIIGLRIHDYYHRGVDRLFYG